MFCGSCPLSIGVLLIIIVAYLEIVVSTLDVIVFLLDDEVDVYFGVVLAIILCFEIFAGVLIFRNYPSKYKRKRRTLVYASLIIIADIIATVLWILFYFFSEYPKEEIYIGVGSPDDDHPNYMQFTKRKFVFYVVWAYGLQAAFFAVAYL